MNLEIILVSNNKHKLQEFREILSPHGIIVYGLSDLNIKLDEIIENGETYFANALIKASAIQDRTTMPILADDTGLEILAMNNEPGLYTARFIEKNGGRKETFDLILRNLKDKDRSAKFICSICLLNMSDKPLRFEGVCEGSIVTDYQIKCDFGYDPIFIEKSSHKTFQEMSKEEKNTLSHRGKALRKLITFLKVNQSIKC